MAQDPDFDIDEPGNNSRSSMFKLSSNAWGHYERQHRDFTHHSAMWQNMGDHKQANLHYHQAENSKYAMKKTVSSGKQTSSGSISSRGKDRKGLN